MILLNRLFEDMQKLMSQTFKMVTKSKKNEYSSKPPLFLLTSQKFSQLHQNYSHFILNFYKILFKSKGISSQQVKSFCSTVLVLSGLNNDHIKCKLLTNKLLVDDLSHCKDTKFFIIFFRSSSENEELL